MKKSCTALAAATVIFAPLAQAETQLVGMSGLSPNAQALKQYVVNTYSPPSIGGVRPCDWVGEHCSGLALDFMVHGNTALGNAIYQDVCVNNKAAHGVRYCLWQVANHYDHVHATVY